MGKSNITKVWLNWNFTNSTAWNYEKYQGLGYAAAMIPALKEIYKDDPEELHEAVRNHMQFFNTNATMATLIMGATLAMEEEEKGDAREAIAGLKTGLMGAMAGIGDTLFNVLPLTILGAIGGYMALEGNPFGIFLMLAYFIGRQAISYYFMTIGYREGTKLITTLSGKLKNLTKSANALGILVVGGMIPSVVQATIAYTYQSGDVEMIIQDKLDLIMPGLIPLLLVAAVYWMLGQKHLNSTRIIFVLLFGGVFLSVIGVLG